MLYKACRLFRTVKYLKLSQIFWRGYYRIIPCSVKIIETPKRARFKELPKKFIDKRPSMKSLREFIFLNQVGNLDEIGWNGGQRSKLWRYNQHYFDYLNSSEDHKYDCKNSNLISEWISHNPIGVGVGWEPYPTSLRIVNWIKWDIAHRALTTSQVDSLAQMSRYLSTRIEKHLLGNHILANSKALIFAGLYFEGLDADTWFQKGIKILHKELPEQILQDGGHFEQSPMYQSIVLEDLLDIKNVLHCFTHTTSVEVLELMDLLNIKITKMLFWLQKMMHPDREISFFNDATFGIAAHPDQIFEYAERLEFQIRHEHKIFTSLENTGYFRVEYPKIVLLGNIGDICAKYIPGHVHADTLSFEMSVNNRRVFVNSGVSKYGTDFGRNLQRSTRSHSTLTINDENSSEVWSGFRVGRRATVTGVKTAFEAQSGYRISARHTGYIHLRGRPVHAREWKISENKLEISDTVSGSGTFDACVYYYLAPDLRLKASSENSFEVINDSSQSIGLISMDNADAFICDTKWHPGFGISVGNLCLVLSKKVRTEETVTMKFELA